MARVLVTGAAGFIGFHTARRLLADGHEVVGVDNLNDYYDVRYKEGRLAELAPSPAFSFHKLDVADRPGMARLFAEGSFERVIHLAAYAGVRHSIEHPQDYIDANLVGFGNILEGCRRHGVPHLLYASSSSVYGANRLLPASTHHPTQHPLSLYAATKQANEAMAHSYAHMYGLRCTGLRFFTVYGPWGRPDMALFIFTRRILAGEPIDVFNHGDMMRDFTYVDDIVEGVVRLMEVIPEGDLDWDPTAPDPASSAAPWRIHNIGNNGPVGLMDMIRTLEEALGRTTEKRLLPMQTGDVKESFADVSGLVAATGYDPGTPLRDGIERFLDWYCDFHGVPRR
jgi:UDP-glucuronate 4-epimerase